MSEVVRKKNSLKLQPVRKSNGGKKLELNGFKREMTILSFYIPMPTGQLIRFQLSTLNGTICEAP